MGWRGFDEFESHRGEFESVEERRQPVSRPPRFAADHRPKRVTNNAVSSGDGPFVFSQCPMAQRAPKPSDSFTTFGPDDLHGMWWRHERCLALLSGL